MFIHTHVQSLQAAFSLGQKECCVICIRELGMDVVHKDASVSHLSEFTGELSFFDTFFRISMRFSIHELIDRFFTHS